MIHAACSYPWQQTFAFWLAEVIAMVASVGLYLTRRELTKERERNAKEGHGNDQD